jgi:hypothetical protein
MPDHRTLILAKYYPNPNAHADGLAALIGVAILLTIAAVVYLIVSLCRNRRRK